MASIVGERGQITIEKALRDDLAIQPGWQVIQRREGDQIVLSFLPPRHRRSLRGALANPSGPKFPDDDALRDATEAAWAAELHERYGKDVEVSADTASG